MLLSEPSSVNVLSILVVSTQTRHTIPAQNGTRNVKLAPQQYYTLYFFPSSSEHLIYIATECWVDILIIQRNLKASFLCSNSSRDHCKAGKVFLKCTTCLQEWPVCIEPVFIPPQCTTFSCLIALSHSTTDCFRLILCSNIQKCNKFPIWQEIIPNGIFFICVCLQQTFLQLHHWTSATFSI